MDESPEFATGDAEAPSFPLPAHIDRALTGVLPCAFCGYNLKGLSIRSVCPECGTAIRATILYTVDPHAEEFRPLNGRLWVAFSLVVVSVCGLAAILFCWAPRIAEVVGLFTLNTPETDWAPIGAMICVIGSGLGMLGIVRPVKDSPISHTLAAMLSLVCYAPLVWILWMIASIDLVHGMPYFGGRVVVERAALKLGLGAVLITMILAIRPNARELVKRSLALRTGRVDRQTLLAMVAVVGIAALGDLIRLGAAQLGLASNSMVVGVGSLLVVIGSGLFTLGAAGAVIDCWRIRKAILTPSPSLHEIMSPEANG